MFKHILVATDGSKLSGKAIRTAVRLAAASMLLGSTAIKVLNISKVPVLLVR